MKIITLATILSLAPLASIASVVTDSLVKAVRHYESADGTQLVGDGGKAIGPYQFHKAAWTDVNKLRRAQGLKQYDYQYAYNEQISKIYCKMFLKDLERRINREIGPKYTCSPAGVYIAWNYGYQAFKRRGFNRSQVPKWRRKRAEEVETLTKQLSRRHV
tara:strand:+ start:6801 stop:7280 length:480 start_codon:yes stop_codon:yes gene_type:complete